MKIYCIITLLTLISSENSFSQIHCMVDTLKSSEAKIMYDIIRDYADNDNGGPKTVAFLFIKEKARTKTYYYGQISSSVEMNPVPNYYFVTPKDNLVIVYSDNKDFFKSITSRPNEFDSLKKKHFDPEPWRFNIHSYVWNFKTKNGKIKKEPTKLNQKRFKGIPIFTDRH